MIAKARIPIAIPQRNLISSLLLRQPPQHRRRDRGEPPRTPRGRARRAPEVVVVRVLALGRREQRRALLRRELSGEVEVVSDADAEHRRGRQHPQAGARELVRARARRRWPSAASLDAAADRRWRRRQPRAGRRSRRGGRRSVAYPPGSTAQRERPHEREQAGDDCGSRARCPQAAAMILWQRSSGHAAERPAPGRSAVASAITKNDPAALRSGYEVHPGAQEFVHDPREPLRRRDGPHRSHVDGGCRRRPATSAEARAPPIAAAARPRPQRRGTAAAPRAGASQCRRASPLLSIRK